MPQAGALICSSRDNMGAVENQNGVERAAAQAARSVLSGDPDRTWPRYRAGVGRRSLDLERLS